MNTTARFVLPAAALAAIGYGLILPPTAHALPGICGNPLLSPAEQAQCMAMSGGTGANHCSAWYCSGGGAPAAIPAPAAPPPPPQPVAAPPPAAQPPVVPVQLPAPPPNPNALNCSDPSVRGQFPIACATQPGLQGAPQPAGAPAPAPAPTPCNNYLLAPIPGDGCIPYDQDAHDSITGGPCHLSESGCFPNNPNDTRIGMLGDTVAPCLLGRDEGCRPIPKQPNR